MGDLFRENPVPMSREQKILKAIFGDSEETWLKREAEAGKFMSAYIDRHPDYLEDAVITAGALHDFVRMQMEELRRKYIPERGKYEGADLEENDFAFAKRMLTLGALGWIVRNFERDEGDCFIHLCEKGCTAVQSIMKNRKEEH